MAASQSVVFLQALFLWRLPTQPTCLSHCELISHLRARCGLVKWIFCSQQSYRLYSTHWSLESVPKPIIFNSASSGALQIFSLTPWYVVCVCAWIRCMCVSTVTVCVCERLRPERDHVCVSNCDALCVNDTVCVSHWVCWQLHCVLKIKRCLFKLNLNLKLKLNCVK